MATIDYAKKYASQVSERFVEGTKTAGLVNQKYDFTGVKSVKVYNISTAPLNDYKRTGSNRFGTPAELDATTEEMTMSQEKAFTFVIDAMDKDETGLALEAGTALSRQIREVIVPELDKYRFAKMVEKAGHTKEVELTAENIYEVITEGTELLDDAEVPQVGRQLVVSPSAYRLMKLSKDIILDTDLSDEQRKRGVIALIDGLEVNKVPSSRLPENVDMLVSHQNATCAPVKLAVYRVHTEVPGIHGALAEGLVYHDAFVLENNKKQIFAVTAPTLTKAKK